MLHPGDPLCAPSPAIMVESVISLVRTLLSHGAWSEVVSKELIGRLRHVSWLADHVSLGSGEEGAQTTERQTAGDRPTESDDKSPSTEDILGQI